MMTAGIVRKLTALILMLAVLGGLRVSCVEPERYDAARTPLPTATPVPTPEPTPVPTEEPTPEPTSEPTPTPTPGPVEATLMFVGDLMCLGAQQHAAMGLAQEGQRFDFRSSFDYVKPILESADCAFGNLETVISTHGPYSYQEPRISDMPNCNAPREYLDAVKYAGFDVLSLSNNHNCDAGEQGVYDTLDAVDEYGFQATGLFRTETDDRFILVDVKGITIGFLAYSKPGYNGKAGSVPNRSYVLNTFSEEKVTRDIAAAKAAGAELVICYVHWDHEHYNTPSSETREQARMFANAGADIICGAHPHAVQPTVWLTADDGRQVLCMYSLGNFVSSMSQDTATDTLIAEVHIRKEFGGTVEITEDMYHPAHVYYSIDGARYVVVPTSNTELPSIQSSLASAHERIMRILMNER